jgi:protein gp37
MLLCPQHTFQVLTKRPERMLEYMEGRDLRKPIAAAARIWPKHRVGSTQWPPANVWLGVSVEDQETADERIPILLETPAAVRWISAEPLLGPIDLRDAHFAEIVGQQLDWVVVGGESGKDSRPMHPDWARKIRDACSAARVPFLFKQWGEWLPTDRYEFAKVGKRCAGRLLDGRTWDEYPRAKNWIRPSAP